MKDRMKDDTLAQAHVDLWEGAGGWITPIMAGYSREACISAPNLVRLLNVVADRETELHRELANVSAYRDAWRSSNKVYREKLRASELLVESLNAENKAWEGTCSRLEDETNDLRSLGASMSQCIFIRTSAKLDAKRDLRNE